MLGIRFIKTDPNTYLLQYRSGRLVREGVGQSFYYYSPSTSLVAVPVASTDAPFIFEETTADFQSVTLQGQVTYRVADAKRQATLLNFTLNNRRGHHASEDPQKLRIFSAVWSAALDDHRGMLLISIANYFHVSAIQTRQGEPTPVAL